MQKSHGLVTNTVQDYVKKLYTEEQTRNGKYVQMQRLARAVGVTPGSATSMVKHLSQAGIVNYQPRVGCTLTEEGRSIALSILRKHRLIELFLVQTLQLDWSVVHEEAEVLEHAFSDRLIERIDELLNHPTVDPHGDPIPEDSGYIANQSARTLQQCRSGETLRISRVLDQGEAFLTFAKQHCLVPGTVVHVTDRSDVADTITYEISDNTFTIGRAPALLVLVEPE